MTGVQTCALPISTALAVSSSGVLALKAAGTTDAALEKHVPDYKVEGNRVIVTVGSVEHPMLPEHYIEWVALQTKQGVQRKFLRPEDKPTTCFSLCDGDEVEAVYAYCNLHSLWKA